MVIMFTLPSPSHKPDPALNTVLPRYQEMATTIRKIVSVSPFTNEETEAPRGHPRPWNVNKESSDPRI
jgi:hypothetical protein